MKELTPDKKRKCAICQSTLQPDEIGKICTDCEEDLNPFDE